MFVNPLKS